MLNGNLIEQAITNLVNNSIKYSDPSKTVHLSAEINNAQLTLQVTDEGFGIPTHHLKRIFERFYRIDKARSRDVGGTGLGLAIVNHIASAHGGFIEVTSEPGVGSRFSLHLPHAIPS